MDDLLAEDTHNVVTGHKCLHMVEVFGAKVRHLESADEVGHVPCEDALLLEEVIGPAVVDIDDLVVPLEVREENEILALGQLGPAVTVAGLEVPLVDLDQVGLGAVTLEHLKVGTMLVFFFDFDLVQVVRDLA